MNGNPYPSNCTLQCPFCITTMVMLLILIFKNFLVFFYTVTKLIFDQKIKTNMVYDLFFLSLYRPSLSLNEIATTTVSRCNNVVVVKGEGHLLST